MLSKILYKFSKFLHINSSGIWISRNPKFLNKEHEFDEELCRNLAVFFHDKSVSDFGCGKGQYVKYFRSCGINAGGFDGNPYTSEITSDLCQKLNLAKPVSLEQEFDWVLSLEVGEHIPRKYEQVFIDNLANHAIEGIVLSWAVEGQGGFGHVNERSNEYIEKQLASRTFIRDKEAECSLRQTASLHWFMQTLMVFRRCSTAQ